MSLEDSVAVSLLSEKEFSQEDHDRPRRRPSFSVHHRGVYTICCLLVGSAASLLMLGTAFRLFQHSLSRAPEFGNGLKTLRPGDVPVKNDYWCGTSSEEARSHGCIFDITLYSWIPAPCYDTELNQDYLSRPENVWYGHGGDARDQLDVASVLAGNEYVAWIDWKMHIHHCKFIFRRMTRVLMERNLGVPGTFIDYFHTLHCIDVIAEEEFWQYDVVNTRMTANYSTCYDKLSPGLANLNLPRGLIPDRGDSEYNVAM